MTTRCPFLLSAVALLALLLLNTACREPRIRTYDAPKDPPPAPLQLPPASADAAATPPAPAAMPPMAGMSAEDAARAGVAAAAGAPHAHWTVPAGWQEKPAGAMRAGTLAVSAPDGRGAEVAVTVFPGDVGGDLANVNRWRGQLQLPPVTAAQLSSVITTLDAPAGLFLITDMTSEAALIDGKYKSRTLGAWLKQPERTWFFKFSGEAGLIGEQRETFLAFLQTVSFHDGRH
ncbi:hypothetical protein OH491_01085 [Termitidicoccus mucosus]